MGVFVQLEMLGPHRWTVELEQPPPFEYAIDDCLREVGVVKHPAPFGQRLVGRHDHRPLSQMALVDDVEEHVGGVGAVGEIPELVDLCSAEHNSTHVESSVMWSAPCN